jgi:hypothetical protein
MADLLGERSKKNQGVQHKNRQQPRLQRSSEISRGKELPQPTKLPLRLRSTQGIKSAVFLQVFFCSQWPVGTQEALTLSECHSSQKQSG